MVYSPTYKSGSTIITLLHDRINPKDCQVLFLGDTGFLQFFRVVSRDDKANPVNGVLIVVVILPTGSDHL